MHSETQLDDLTLALAALVEQFQLKAKTEVSPSDWPAWRLLVFLADQITVEQSEAAREVRQSLMHAILADTRSASELDLDEVLQLLYQLARNERAGSSGNPEGANFFWRFLSSPGAQICLEKLARERNHHLARVDLLAIQQDLKASPMFQLSLSSRELFHSNFIAWLIDKYPACIGEIFPTRFAVFNELSVQREKHNLDLLVTFKTEDRVNGMIVIENKVKDAPRLDQLEGYQQKLEAQYPGFKIDKFLLSLVPPAKAVRDLEGWRFLDYGTLGLNLKRWASSITLPDEDRVVIDLYARMIRNLSQLLGAVFAHNGLPQAQWIMPSKTSRHGQIEKVLAELRLSETVGKFQASILLDEVRAKLPQTLSQGQDCKLQMDYGLTNKSPMIDAVLVRATNGGELRLGVQLQGRQYRRFIDFEGFKVPQKSSAKAKIDALRAQIDKADGFRWLISPTVDVDGWISPRHPTARGLFVGKLPTSMMPSAPINSYAPHFIYQYISLIDKDGKPTVNLADLPFFIAEDLNYAASLLRDPAYISRFDVFSV